MVTSDLFVLRFFEQVEFYERHEFLEALNANAEFSNFWAIVQHQHPSKQDYFLSLITEDEPFDPQWLKSEYNL